jgi:hypothetical protein
MTASHAVANRTLAKTVLWTTGTNPQESSAVPGVCPRVIHTVSTAPPATMDLVHRIHRPYDDDET